MKELPMLLQFKPFGFEHMIVIGLTICLSVLLSVFVRRSHLHRFKRVVCITIACILIAVEWFNYAWVLAHDGRVYFVENCLPLHVCGITLYLTAYMLLIGSRKVFQVVYFWAFAGTIQAMLTPVDQEGFPSWDCFHFFLTHGGVIIGAAVATFGLRMRPTLKGLAVTYVLSWVMVFVVGWLNALLGTNYMYLCAPPSGSTPFYFLSWPWYIPFLGLLALILYILLWLPFCGFRRKEPKNVPENRN